ncbi:FHIPEP family type III secretion protein [Streptomyces sp. HC307]|uniref:FHIPEP family type III secretion protein n=1 Tax=Streptomyces flavusporus TaxID=3385496 RepID=UPI003917583E
MTGRAGSVGGKGSATAGQTGGIGLTAAVTVSGPLARYLGSGSAADSSAAAVCKELSKVAAALGLPGPVAVDVVSSCEDHVAPENWIKLYVDGRRCRYPAELLAQLAAALDGRQAGRVHPPLPEDWPERPASDQPSPTARASALERVVALVGLVCAEAVKLRPSALLGPGWLTAYAVGLGQHLPDRLSAVVTPEWLAEVLSGVLDLGIGIGDMASVAGVLTECQETRPRAARELLVSALATDGVDVLVPDTIAPLLGKGDVGDSGDLLGYVAAALFEENGILVPPFRVVPPDGIPEACFAFRVNSLLTAPLGLLAPDDVLVNDIPQRLGLLGAEARPAVNPASGLPGALVPATYRQRLEDMGMTTWGPADYIVLCLAQELRSRAGQLVHQDKVQAQLDVLEDVLPAVVGAARARLQSAELTALVRGLADDKVWLRNLPPLLERIIDSAHAQPGPDRFLVFDDPVTASHTTAAAEPDDPAWLEGFVRTGLRREIADSHTRHTGTLVVYLLDAAVDRLLREGLDEEREDRLIAAVKAELAQLPETAQLPFILTDDDLRPVLRPLLARVLPRIGVVGYGDLPPDLNVKPVARIAMDVAEPTDVGRPR